MSQKAKYHVGQWVRYYWGGELRIDEVRYVRERDHYPWGVEYLTDHATIIEDDIVEAR